MLVAKKSGWIKPEVNLRNPLYTGNSRISGGAREANKNFFIFLHLLFGK